MPLGPAAGILIFDFFVPTHARFAQNEVKPPKHFVPDPSLISFCATNLIMSSSLGVIKSVSGSCYFISDES